MGIKKKLNLSKGVIYYYSNTLFFKTGYIGYTKNLKKRNKVHVTSKDNSYFHKAIRKYGINNFKLKIIFECSLKNMPLFEKYFIFLYRRKGYKLYNIHSGGHGGDTLTFHPQKHEIGQKISKSLTGRKYNNTKKRSQETIEKWRQSYKKIKRIPWNKNKIMSIETKQKISLSLKNNIQRYNIIHGRKQSEQTKIKISEARKNMKRKYHHTEETKQKIKLSNIGKNKGKKMSLEARIKMSQSKIGNVYSKNRVPWNKGLKFPYKPRHKKNKELCDGTEES
jgi:hypothetical protein